MVQPTKHNRVRISQGDFAVAGRYDCTAGCDVDADYVVVSLLNFKSQTNEIRQIPQTQAKANAAAKWLKQNKVEFIVLESTANYHLTFYHACRKLGLNVHIINPAQVTALLRIEGKSDKADATNLAMLAATFPLRTSNVPDAQQMEIRSNLRNYDRDRKALTKVKQRVHQELAQFGINIFRETTLRTQSGRAFLEALSQTEDAAEMIVQNHWKGSPSSRPRLIEAMGKTEELPTWLRQELEVLRIDLLVQEQRIRNREQQALNHIEHFELAPQIAWMSTTPGVNWLVALRLIGEMGSDFWQRYSTSRAWCKALGVAPNTLVSAGKVLKTSKALGNNHAKRHLLMQMRNWLLRNHEHPLKQWQVQYRAKAGFRKSVSACCNKAMTSLYHQGRHGGLPYNPSRMKLRFPETI